MASIPQFYYSNQTLPCDYSDFTTMNPLNGVNSSVMEENTMWGDHHHRYGLVPLLDNTFGSALDHDDHTVSSIMHFSDPWLPALPEHRSSMSPSDLAVPEVSDLQTHHDGFYGINSNNNEGFHQSFSSGLLYQQPYIGDFGDECRGSVEDVKPLACPKTSSRDNNWGIQGNQVAAVDRENIKVGRYSEEERKERILRYLRKRNQRNFNKTIKYACRKTLADRRVRVRGRFARNNELSEDEMTMKKNIENLQQYDLYGGDSIQFQLKNEEEDWLQGAMESLVFLSHSSPEDI
ncbi:uncharacterized protein LOC129314923 [Prosopis cineraria]|uniref:uncharacterized protein LOC129314923 n=1 Tax=Prosopis cineraria TaxID=364024 RepID=UPI0024107088|nr:uncharacterized protein LOC129314923 [Prosopis cineraria]